MGFLANFAVCFEDFVCTFDILNDMDKDVFSMFEGDVIIRPTRMDEADEVMAVYGVARKFMRSRGNHEQWVNGYPDRATIMNDIGSGCHYIGRDLCGRIVLVFSFIIGEEPTYAVIEGGRWGSSDRYGTIHRLASGGIRGGCLRLCVEFCKGAGCDLRIDTHASNVPMLAAIMRSGFRRCGVIHVSDGSPREAFELCVGR